MFARQLGMVRRKVSNMQLTHRQRQVATAIGAVLVLLIGTLVTLQLTRPDGYDGPRYRGYLPWQP